MDVGRKGMRVGMSIDSVKVQLGGEKKKLGLTEKRELECKERESQQRKVRSC